MARGSGTGAKRRVPGSGRKRQEAGGRRKGSVGKAGR